VRCWSASLTGALLPVILSGAPASTLTLTSCALPDRLVTSSAMVALSPGAMKRGIASSATIGAATAIRRSVPLKSGKASGMVASPLASSTTGPLNRSTSRTLRGRLCVSRWPASPPKRCLAALPSIFSISLP